MVNQPLEVLWNDLACCDGTIEEFVSNVLETDKDSRDAVERIRAVVKGGLVGAISAEKVSLVDCYLEAMKTEESRELWCEAAKGCNVGVRNELEGVDIGVTSELLFCLLGGEGEQELAWIEGWKAKAGRDGGVKRGREEPEEVNGGGSGKKTKTKKRKE